MSSNLIESSFRIIFENFSRRIASMRQFAEDIGPLADKSDETSVQQYVEVITQILSKATGETIVAKTVSVKFDTSTSPPPPQAKQVNVTPELAWELAVVARNMSRSQSHHGPTLRQGAMIMAVAQLDALVAALLRHHYGRVPDLANDSEHPFTFKDLCEIGTIETAREIVVTRKIESILYKSLRDQLEYFRKTLKIELSYLDKWLDILDETVQRRHIWVHNNGKVSKLYLKRVSKSLAEQYNAVEDTELSVDHIYLRRCIDRINLSGVIVSRQCWRKWYPGELASANSALNANIFQAVLDKRYSAAIYLGEYALVVCESPEQERLNLILNLAQAYKWNRKAAKAIELVDGIDWTTKDMRFRLANFAIRGELDRAFAILPQAIQSGSLGIQDLREWPIFAEMRTDARFETIIQAANSK